MHCNASLPVPRNAVWHFLICLYSTGYTVFNRIEQFNLYCAFISQLCIHITDVCITCVCTHTCTYICTHTFMHIYTHLYMHEYKQSCVCVYRATSILHVEKSSFREKCLPRKCNFLICFLICIKYIAVSQQPLALVPGVIGHTEKLHGQLLGSLDEKEAKESLSEGTAGGASHWIAHWCQERKKGDRQWMPGKKGG